MLIQITGTVQGVGFRPFVARLAAEHHVAGTVCNDSAGVVVQAWARPDQLAGFVRALSDQAPPAAVIRHIDLSWDQTGSSGPPEPGRMVVIASRTSANVDEVTADLACCQRCAAEIRDPGDRRFGYAFNSCADCGPRFSISTSLPFDRPTTTMDRFPMCQSCQAEYDDIGDRRFLAQTISCPDCGPTLVLLAGSDRQPPPAIPRAVALLEAGGVLAVKGVGGYQLMADAGVRAAVARVRAAKARPTRPLAVMFADLASASRHVALDAPSRALLTGPAAPIVIAEVRPTVAHAYPDIAPGLREWGVMLPNSPLHHLLLAGRTTPVVCTSANPPGEPMIIDDSQAGTQLHVADAILGNDRAIRHRVDDAVHRQGAGGPIVLRRGRGQAPGPLQMPGCSGPDLLAVGADMKAAFALVRSGQVLVSQHFGDLAHAQVHRAFVEELSDWLELFAVRPTAVVCDAHPDYHSTGFAERFATRHGLPLLRVQHHRAHVAAVALEHQVDPAEPIMGISLDGLGYGDDARMWGGELFAGPVADLRHLGGLAGTPMPGGDLAVRQPWRMAAAHLQRSGLAWQQLPQFAAVGQLARAAVSTVMADRGAPQTTALGRVLDAAAFLLGAIGPLAEYDGQAPALLEAMAAGSQCPESFEYAISRDGNDRTPRVGALELDLGPAWQGLVALLGSRTRADLARMWHNTVIAAYADLVAAAPASSQFAKVILAGGCVQNVILGTGLRTALTEKGYLVLVPADLPCNDGAVSAGQAWVAACSIGSRQLDG